MNREIIFFSLFIYLLIWWFDSRWQFIAPLFGGDGLAVIDLLLAQPGLEMRLHAVELLSAVLVHKKVQLLAPLLGSQKKI